MAAETIQNVDGTMFMMFFRIELNTQEHKRKTAPLNNVLSNILNISIDTSALEHYDISTRGHRFGGAVNPFRNFYQPVSTFSEVSHA